MSLIRIPTSWICGAVFALSAATALAHVPVFSDGSAVSPETAIQVADVNVSRVVYHEVTADASQVWVTFPGTAGQEVYFQLGVPYIERLASYRPSFAIIGPGLPAIDLPFDIPEGLGGLLFDGPGVSEPEFFSEEFTGTESWIIGDKTVTLPADGTYYAVAFVPSGEPGKLWLAMGKAEVFTFEDIVNLPDTINTVRRFHEVEEALVPCFIPLGAILGLGLTAAYLHRSRRTLLTKEPTA